MNAVEKGGNENRAYEIEAEKKVSAAQESNDKTEEKSKQTAENEQKWVSNYVPYGDYPKGNIVYVKEVSISNLISILVEKILARFIRSSKDSKSNTFVYLL